MQLSKIGWEQFRDLPITAVRHHWSNGIGDRHLLLQFLFEGVCSSEIQSHFQNWSLGASLTGFSKHCKDNRVYGQANLRPPTKEAERWAALTMGT